MFTRNADMGLKAVSHKLPVLHRQTKDPWSEAFIPPIFPGTTVARNLLIWVKKKYPGNLWFVFSSHISVPENFLKAG